MFVSICWSGVRCNLRLWKQTHHHQTNLIITYLNSLQIQLHIISYRGQKATDCKAEVDSFHHKSHKIVQNSTKFVISKMLTEPKWSKFLIVKTNMFWTIKTLFCLVMLRWLTRLSAYIISGRYETKKIIYIDSNDNNIVPEGRVYNPDVSRHAVTDFISGDNKQEDNWTLS